MKFSKYGWGESSGCLRRGSFEVDLSEDIANYSMDSISFDTGGDEGVVHLYDDDLDLFLEKCAEFKANRDKRKAQ